MTALLASKYDVSFPPGEDGSSVVEGTLDQFTANPGELRLCFGIGEKGSTGNHRAWFALTLPKRAIPFCLTSKCCLAA